MDAKTQEYIDTYHLKCWSAFDSDSNLWLSGCVQFDLVASGENEDQSWTHLARVLDLYIRAHFNQN